MNAQSQFVYDFILSNVKLFDLDYLAFDSMENMNPLKDNKVAYERKSDSTICFSYDFNTEQIKTKVFFKVCSRKYRNIHKIYFDVPASINIRNIYRAMLEIRESNSQISVMLKYEDVAKSLGEDDLYKRLREYT